VRAHARFLGVTKCQKAAERIDDANYVRGFFLGYENSKKARRLARIIHERFMGLPLAFRKSAECAGKVADSLHFQLDTLKTEFPLFINKTRLRE
jgi:hypothetical protein